jgi:phage gp46-like protein
MNPATTTKVTISLPTDIYRRGEEERTQRGLSRSEFVANLYREHLRQAEQEARIARYAAAYARHPEASDDLAWVTDAGAATLADVAAEEPRDSSRDLQTDTEHRAAR